MKYLIHSTLYFFILSLTLISCQEDDSNIQVDDISNNAFEVRSATGAVYAMDNDDSANQLLVFERSSDGTLSNYTTMATGGTGNGSGLGSQGSIIIHRKFVFVCNAGSNEISVFDTRGNQITLVETTPSGGMMPTSITAHEKRLFVLNAGGDGSITGFNITSAGNLSPIAGSTQPLSNNAAAAAQISFDKEGSYLAVTERATNLITVYQVGQNGTTSSGTSYASAGQTPFGFDFGKDNTLIVSEAFGGAANASTMSSYDLTAGGMVNLIDGPVATNQTAACWVVVTRNGKYAYTTNTGSNSVTGYAITNNGSLNILDADGITGMTGAGPIDAATSRNSKYLYVTNAGSNSISILEISADGGLSAVGEVTGLPESIVGMAAE